MVSIQIEEKHQSKHKPQQLSSNSEIQDNANHVAAKKGKQFGNNKFKRHFKPSGQVLKDQKQNTCYVCENVGHFAKQYKF